MMLSVITLLPLLGALLIGFMPKDAKSSIKWVSLLSALIPAVLSFLLLGSFNLHGSGMQMETHQEWISLPFAFKSNSLSINYDLGIDGLSIPLILLTAVVSVMAMVAAWKLEERVKSFCIWFQLLITGLYGVFVAEDLFLFFFFLELTLVPMYFLLVGYGGQQKRTAIKFLLYRGLASVALLVAFIGLAYQAAHVTNVFTMNIRNIANSFHASSAATLIPVSVRYGLFGVLFLAILIEEAFVPFHTWLPDTHEAAHPAVSMVVGGVLMKIGAYILLRVGVGVLPDAIAHYGKWIALLGVINIVYGALVAMVQKDWRRLLAFGTISHMGIVLLATASLTAAGIQGSVLMMISSGLLSGLLFFLMGLIQERTNTLLIDKLGGLSKSMPVISGVLLVGALGSLGLPGLSGFISEILSFMGGFSIYPVLSTIGTAGVILAAVYMLWAMQRTTYGPYQGSERVKDVTALESIPMIIFVALVVLVGVFPSVVGNFSDHAWLTYLRIGG